MAIKINNQDLQARYINGNSIGKVMLNGWQIRPETVPPTPDPDEYIRYIYQPITIWWTKYIVIPLGWIWHDGNWWVSYNWKVQYRGYYAGSRNPWSEAEYYSWVSAENKCIYISVSSWPVYWQINIKPVYDTYWRALAYSRHSVYNSNPWDLVKKIYSINRDKTYKWYAVSATHTWDYFRAYQYEYYPYSLTEELPNTVTTIWNHFREWQFQHWAFIGNTEVMPSSVTSIGDYFRAYQYYDTYSSWWYFYTYDEAISDNVTTIWNSFRESQFSHCTSLWIPWAEVLPNGLTTIWNDFRKAQFYYCAIDSHKAVAEALPDTVTSIWTWYREIMYNHTWITQIQWWKDLSIWNSYYRNSYCYNESIDTIKVVGDVWYPMYMDTPLDMAWLQNLTQVEVPNAYLSNYQNTTVEPWNSVYPKSKFIWY